MSPTYLVNHQPGENHKFRLGAISKGMTGFLQTSAASVLRRLVVSADLSVDSRDALTAFLSEGSSSEEEDQYPGSPARYLFCGCPEQFLQISPGLWDIAGLLGPRGYPSERIK